MEAPETIGEGTGTEVETETSDGAGWRVLVLSASK
jgi:hypothetical protein